MKNNFGIITNQNASIPLILDNSDSSIKFTERKDVDTNAGNKNNVVLDWDNLDFENTEYYTKIVDKNSTRVKLDLQHSTTANNLYLIDPNPKNLDRIHHPNLDTQRDYKVKYKRIGVKYQESEGAISPYLSDINDLTGTKGTLILLEQTSECPPFILNVGMTSRLVKYWHQSTPDDIPRQMDSLTHLIKPDQESPFIAPIQKSKFVCSISCNLFDVPVAKHEVSQCDFLLVRGMERNQKTKCIEPTNTFYIRRVNAYYCAGLLEAKQRVMRPNKKTTQEFVSNYIKAILINIFRGTEQLPPKKKIQVASVLKEFFPDQNELKLREVLKKFAQHFRNHGNGYWEPRNQNELTQKFQEISIQPENVCSYQSMQAGFKRLRRSGVNILIRSRKVYQQIKNLKGELTKRVAYKIEMELMKTPWARTENFTKAFEGQLMEISRADNGEEIVRSKGRRGKNEGKEQGEQKKQARHGTSSDLRVLTIPQLNEKLKQYKVTMERINKLSRWQRVKLLKELVNEKAQQGIVNDDITKFARGPRSEFQAKVEEYKKIYESSFRNNLVFISSSTNDDSKNDFDDDSLFDMINVEIARQDSDDTDSDSDDYNPNEDSQNNQSQLVEDADDPPELKPYGIATHKFDVNWAELGFEGCAMRKAAKIINVKLEQSKPVVTISWRRAPHQISELEKLENFVNSELSKVKQEDDLETHILQKRKKELQDKLRRAKNSKKKGATSVGSYIQCQHQTFLITDSYNKSLSFDLRSLIVEQIRDANMRYNNFLNNYNPRKKQTSNQANSSSDNDDGFNDAENYTIQKNPRRPNSLVSFNDCIESIINKLIENKAYQCFTYQPTNKSTPDILKELPLNLYSIRDEAHNQRYVSVQKFYDDFKSISDYCKTINSENIKSLCNQMMKEFNDMFMKNKDDLERFANGIDPAFLN